MCECVSVCVSLSVFMFVCICVWVFGCECVPYFHRTCILPKTLSWIIKIKTTWHLVQFIDAVDNLIISINVYCSVWNEIKNWIELRIVRVCISVSYSVCNNNNVTLYVNGMTVCVCVCVCVWMCALCVYNNCLDVWGCGVGRGFVWNLTWNENLTLKKIYIIFFFNLQGPLLVAGLKTSGMKTLLLRYAQVIIFFIIISSSINPCVPSVQKIRSAILLYFIFFLFYCCYCFIVKRSIYLSIYLQSDFYWLNL